MVRHLDLAALFVTMAIYTAMPIVLPVLYYLENS